MKLLRVLQESEFERVGGNKTLKVDVRIIAATNRDLDKQVEKGAFREDLFFRLNVFPIKLPSLKERKKDIPILVNHFLKKYLGRSGKKVQKIPKRSMELLMDYNWPGNVRELENIIERALVISDGSTLKIENYFFPKNNNRHDEEVISLEENEKQYILKILKKTQLAGKWREGYGKNS